MAGAEVVGSFELRAELGGAKVFAEVGEGLLEGVEGFGDGLGVGEGDVAPHGVGAGAEAGGFAQGPAADGVDIGEGLGIGGEAFFEQGGEGGGEHLGEVRDPGAELVVAGGGEVEGAGAEGFDLLAPLLFEGGFGWVFCWSDRGEEPHGVREEVGFGELGAAALFAGHGVSGEEAGAAGGVVAEAGGGFGDGAFGAADVGEEGVGTAVWGEELHPVEGGQDGAGEDDDAGGKRARGGAGGEGGGDGAGGKSGVKGGGEVVPAVDFAGEATCAEGEADGGADEGRCRGW